MIRFPIVDAHLHIWDINKLHYPWLAVVPILNRTFLLEDYNRACGSVPVEKMVFVQCECDPARYRDEVSWVSRIAVEEDDRIRGIVSWAPLENGEKVREELEILRQNYLVKGIRRIIQFEPDIDFCLRPTFVKGVQSLADYGFSFDICISHIQLDNTIRLVRQCPDVQFILDHIGKPDIRNQVLEPWKTQIRELSRMPNVTCKISGLVTEATPYQWTEDDLKSYIDPVIDCFGIDRVMYGGDWPVMLLASADYQTWFRTLTSIIGEQHEEELSKVFYANALRIYQLS